MPTVETEILENCQARLIVSVEPERAQLEKQKAAQRIARQVNIPGFRKGKAPYHIILQYVGEGAIYEELLDSFGQAIYKEALDEAKLEPFAPATLEDVQFEPMVFRFMVPLPPEVDLGAYRDMRIPFEMPEINEEDVDEALDDLQEKHTKLDQVERPVAMGDVAELSIHAVFVNKPFDKQVETQGEQDTEEPELLLDEKAIKVLIAEDATYPVPGFPAHIVGMAAGDERSFDITLPEDDESLDEEYRGATLHFDVKCNLVFERQVPALDDEFARQVGDYTDLADLRAKLRVELQKAAERAAHAEYADRALERLDESAVTVKYPPVMLEEELDELLEQFDQQLRRSHLTLDDYCRINNITKEKVREDFRETAERRLRRSLIIGKFIDAEQLEVGEEELNDGIETSLLAFGEEAPLARQILSAPRARQSLATKLLIEKARLRLVQIARGEAPEAGQESSTAVAESVEAKAEGSEQAGVDEPSGEVNQLDSDSSQS